jgi:hypothetical protein
LSAFITEAQSVGDAQRWRRRALAHNPNVCGLDGCDANGQKLAFARTKAARFATGDPRPSPEERYSNHAAYVEQVRHTAGVLKDKRFLLDEDVTVTFAAAEAANVP